MNLTVPENRAGLSIAVFLVGVAIVGKLMTGWAVFGLPGINRFAIAIVMHRHSEILVSIGRQQRDRPPSNSSLLVMIRPWKKLATSIKELFGDEGFLTSIHVVENLVSKVLSLALVGVVLVSLADLIIFLYRDLFREPVGFFSNTLIEIFGMFLNILIALELLENITAYLRRHVVQVELVIVTALIAVARKLIIFDFSKASGIDLVGLATASFALAISYWLIHRMNRKHREDRG